MKLRAGRDCLTGRRLDELAVDGIVDWRLAESIRTMGLACNGFKQFEVEVDQDGQPGQRWFVTTRQISFEPDADMQAIVIGIEDITQEIAIADELVHEKQAVRSLTAEVVLAEERQRRHIALGLHDGPLQTLVLLQKQLRQLTIIDPEVEIERLRSCLALTERVIRDTRKLVCDISPPVLYDLGLSAALDWLTEQFRKIHGLNTTFIRQSERLLGDRPCHVLCFRAVRELLMNAVKHAPCSEVVVLAGQFEQNIQIVVRDNGPGFDTSRLGVRVDGSMGFGLLSILEQVRGMGGDFELDSDIGQGTQITLTMPADNTS